MTESKLLKRETLTLEEKKLLEESYSNERAGKTAPSARLRKKPAP